MMWGFMPPCFQVVRRPQSVRRRGRPHDGYDSCTSALGRVRVRRMPAAERSPQPTVVRVGDISAVVTAVVHVLGFQPAESLVAVALRGPRERMYFTLRLDLPAPPDRDVVAREVITRMAQAQADAVILFVFTAERPVADELPHDDLVGRITVSPDVRVRDAFLVVDDRLWSYLCNDACCPSEGRPFETTSPDALAVAAAHALNGRAVLPDRETAIAAVQPLGDIVAVSMRQAMAGARDEMTDAGVDAFSRRVGDEVTALTARFDDPRAKVDDDEAARIAVALHDVLLRDEMLVRLSEDEGSLRRLLEAVARRAQPPHDAAVCTCVGWAAYADGDGLLASAALDRALTSDPDYTMADLTFQLLQAQVPPEEIRKSARRFAPDVRSEIASRRRRRRRCPGEGDPGLAGQPLAVGPEVLRQLGAGVGRQLHHLL